MRRFGLWMGWIAACVLALASPGALAQDAPPPTQEATEAGETQAPPPADPDLDNPEHTLTTFLDAMFALAGGDGQLSTSQRNAYRKDILKTLDPDAIATAIAGINAATNIYEVLNRLGEVPTVLGPAAQIRATEEGRFTLFPSQSYAWLPGYSAVQRQADDAHVIELARDERGEWRFTRETIENAHSFFQAVEDLPRRAGREVGALTNSQWIRERMPRELTRGEILGIEYWQWVGLFAILLVGFAADMLVRGVLRIAWTRFTARGVSDPQIVKRAVRPFGMLAAAAIFYFSVELLGLPPAMVFIPLLAVRVYFVFATVQAAFRVTDLATDYFQRRAATTRGKLDDLLIPLIRRVVKVFILVAAALYIARTFDYDVLPLLTGLGIGGLAFAFAAKDTIENFFGSVAVIADRPFEVGDWVVIGDSEGTVESMGLRSTRIRTFYNSQVTVPNAELVRARVDNYGRRVIRRYKTHLAITYSTPPNKIEAFCEGIREIIRQHPYTYRDSYHVWLNQFGDHSLDVLVYMFHRTPDWATELRERHRFMLDVIRLADQLGVEFAFPTQTLHMSRFDPNAQHEPKPTPRADAEDTAREMGRTAAGAVLGDAAWKNERPGPVRFGPAPEPPTPPSRERARRLFAWRRSE